MPESDKRIISPYNVIPESNHKVKRMKEMITNTKQALDCSTNSPCQHLRKCIENSMENIYVRVQRVTFR